MPPVRAIIADDEAPLREFLLTLLRKAWPDLEIVGVAENGVQALELIRREAPDIAFLDIKMPALSGLQVAAHSNGLCEVVFITAYDEYAIEAFDREAIDYLLKPVEEERLARTVARIKDRLSGKQQRKTNWESLAELITNRLGETSGQQYLRWIRVARKDEMFLVPVEDVVYFQASDKYTSVFTRDGEFLIRKPIKELERELDPNQFWRIHRSVIVNAHHIAVTHRLPNGNLSLKLKHRPEILQVSRAYTFKFRQM